MILGLIAGGVLRGDREPWAKVASAGRRGRRRAWRGLGLRRCWASARSSSGSGRRAGSLFSGGWCFLLLAGVLRRHRRQGYREVAFPSWSSVPTRSRCTLLVHVATDYLTRSWVIHLGRAPFEVLGPVFAPVLLGACTLAVFWLMLAWMYRHRV